MDWERWLQTNAGVLSLALAIALTLVPLAVAGAASECFSLLAHRAENRAGRRRVLGHASSKGSAFDRLKRFRRILSLPPGKL